LRGIVADRGADTPLAAWGAIAQLSELGPASEHLAALRQLAAGRPESRGPRWLRAVRQLGAEALERESRLAVPELRDVDELSAAAELLLDAGRYGAALRLFRHAVASSPNSVRAQRGLAQAEALRAASPEAAGRANAVLRRVKRLEPQDASVAAELAFRQAADTAAAAEPSHDDERFLVEPAQFLARARTTPAEPGKQFERQLHFLRVVRLHPDKRVSQLVHYAREIVVEPRTEAERQEPIPALSPHTELLRARVHRSDGTVLPPEEQETPSDGLPSVRWPKLRPGDVVEVALRAWTPGPIGRRGEMPFYFVDYVGSVETRPVLYNEVVIDAPDGGPLSFDVLNGAPARREVERRAGRTVTRLIWDAPPTLPDEPFRPPPSESLPVVVGSGFANWDQFVAWYRGAVEGFTEPDEQIRRLAAELTAAQGGRPLGFEEKVAALFEFVADDIRYVNYVSGEWWLPNRPQQLLARRQGDCDDKAMLLISLLRAVGIDAVEVLIQTRLVSQPGILQSPRVAIPMFDHGIIYLPAQQGRPGRFLDATNPQSRLGPPVSMDSGGMALLVPPPEAAGVKLELPEAARGPRGEARVMRTPGAAAVDHGVEATWTLSISSEGEGALRAEEQHVGDAALLLRTHLRQPDARAQWIEQHLLAGWLPTVEMEPDVDFEGDLPGGRARLGYRARSRLLARREGPDLVVHIAPPMPLTARLAPQPTRSLPVVLPPQVAPRHNDLTVRLEAPRTHRFAALPPDRVVDGGELGKARQSFALAPTRGSGGGEVLVLTRQIALEKWAIDPPDYARWRAFLQQIDRLLQHGVRLVPR
ncbi:MAG: hypothetical protein JRI23_34945, partial [Deltaproteobacteria bacterium]|nr:hypothetical protein [Deltaproteobacteria bacterium]MBW2537505.1 hypothetical protein [Deltaproteobacteria bacterium]